MTLHRLVMVALTALLLGLFWGCFSISAIPVLVLLLFSSLLVGCLFSLKKLTFVVVAVVCISFLAGFYRGRSIQSQILHAQTHESSEIELAGTVVSGSSLTDTFQVELFLENVRVEGDAAPGRYKVRSFGFRDVRRGDRVVVSGKLLEGFGSTRGLVSFAEVVSIERGSIRSTVEEFRSRFISGVIGSSGEQVGSLGVGFLIGNDALLDRETEEGLRRSGLTHIVAVSGYNLSVLVAFSRRFFSKYSRFQALAGSMILMAVFVFFAGIAPSVSRAIFVSLLSSMLWFFGEKPSAGSLLLWSSALSAFWRPFYLWGDIGWYLSFAAFFGVLVIAPKLQSIFFKGKQNIFTSLFMETSAAQLMTVPIIVFIFGRLSVTSISASVLVGPLVPIAMVTSFFTGVTSFISPVVAGLIGLVNRFFVGAILIISEVHAAPNWAIIEFDSWLLPVLLAVLIISILLIKRVGRSAESLLFRLDHY